MFCLRENNWSITEREVPAWTKNNLVPGTRLVVFLQAPCDAYKAPMYQESEDESNEGTPTSVLGDDQFSSSSSDEDSRSSTSSVMSNPKTMPKHDNDANPAKHDSDTKPGDHTPDVDHGVVNVATQEPKSETVIESSEQCVDDLHSKTDPEYELTCNVAILKSESVEDSKRSSASVDHVEKHM